MPNKLLAKLERSIFFMVESKRKKGEKFESFLRRHNQNVTRSGNPKLIRFKKFVSQKLNKFQKKKRALFGQKLRHNREYMQKIGKLKEDERNKRW